MILPRQAFELLVTPHGPMKCKSPNFPSIKFIVSECGKYKHFKCEKFFIVVFHATSTRNAMMVSGFYQGLFSNFSDCRVVCKIGGQDVTFDCGEQAFKAACAVFHLSPNTIRATSDPLVDESADEQNLKVLKAILDAPEPKHAKRAVYGANGLANFNSKSWDEVSPQVMYWVQLLKFKNAAFRDFGLEIARIAKEEGVKPENIFVTEAAGSDDRIWGTGPGANVSELFEMVCKEGNSVKLYNNLVDPRKSREPEDVVFVGFNGLGKAIEHALCDLIGENFEGLDETMEQFIARVDEFNGFELFEYDLDQPEAKRSRSTPSSDEAEPTIQRTFSADVSEGGNEADPPTDCCRTYSCSFSG
jgi:predicted NAD-dependent protein-ADP-ribosyltransferase YbiA (DUF1768 family)